PDGEISIQAFGEDLQFSVDGGQTYETACDQLYLCRVGGLTEGEYEVVVRQGGACTAAWPDQPIVLRAPPGDPQGDCENGDLEEGTFRKWVRYGFNGKGEDTPGSFSILNREGFVDRDEPLINGDYEALGTYLMMIGDGNSGANKDVAQYCFVVDEDNQDFQFTYAVALEDPSHLAHKRPYFRYEIILNRDYDNPLEEVTTVSNDPFLLDGSENEIYKYKGWTCVSYNLSDHLGEEICVRFTVRDCTKGGHEAHAYVDGLCVDNLTPIIKIEGEEIYCDNQSVNLHVVGGGYTYYQWVVGKLDENGQEYDVLSKPLALGYDASIYNLLTQYVNDSDYSKDCVDYFARVYVTGSCGPANAAIRFSLACASYTLDYCEKLVICSPGLMDVSIIAEEIDCVGCTFDWQPANYFYDHTLAVPTIRGQAFTDALNRKYELKVTTPEGCIYNRVIKVRNDAAYDMEYTVDTDYCQHRFTFTLNFQFDIDPSLVSLAVRDENNNLVDVPTYLEEDSEGSTIKYQLLLDRDRREDFDLELDIGVDYESASNICPIGLEGQCDRTFDLGEYPRSIFPKPWKMFIGNGIDPLRIGDGGGVETDSIFHPHFASPVDGPCEDYTSNSSIYYLKMEVFDRWGAVLFSKDISVPTDAEEGIRGDEIYWDGYVRCGLGGNACPSPCEGEICMENNQPIVHPSGVYTYVLTLLSCTKESGYCADDYKPCNETYGNHCSDGLNQETIISGDVTLIR
ncbi:MAG: hypothetical protein AAFQ92_25800, partial [Bacteroidota bacterium]